MSVYSNVQLRQAIKKGHVVCHPLVKQNIAGSSIDVTLGNWFYRTERTGVSGFYNPFAIRLVDTGFNYGSYTSKTLSSN